MITRLKNIYWLYSVNKNISKLEKRKFDDSIYDTVLRITYFYNSFPRKKYKIERGLVASIVKQVRSLYPYQVKGETEAEKLYKEYFTLENHIPSFDYLKKGMYLKRFRNSYPVKGVRYSEYYLNFESFPCDIYRIKEKSKYGTWVLTDVEGGYWVDSIGDYEITAFLLTTKEEIEEFKSRQKEYKNLEKEIQKKLKEINKLKEKQKKI
jgi:hypothetical protein